jgi:regulator of sirC expression with transglutaminase-like and TPR domain
MGKALKIHLLRRAPPIQSLQGFIGISVGMIDEISFLDELKKPTINIPRAALTLARSIAYPILDVDSYMTRLNTLAKNAYPYVAASKSLSERVDALSEYLFYQMNFRGNRDEYDDPRNSYLNCVLDRKLGIPISLGTIYIAIAQRLGMRCYGVGLPGHFIVGIYEAGSEILIDPFNTGLRLSIPDCARLVRETTGRQITSQSKWLTPISPSDLLARMLTNLCNAYIQREDWRSAIPVIQHLLIIQPETNFHLRDLGYLYLYNGSLRMSANYLEEYLRRAPDAVDFDNVRSSLQIVAGRLALWN